MLGRSRVDPGRDRHQRPRQDEADGTVCGASRGDTETRPTRLGPACQIAERVGATYLRLDVRGEAQLERVIFRSKISLHLSLPSGAVCLVGQSGSGSGPKESVLAG